MSTSWRGRLLVALWGAAALHAMTVDLTQSVATPAPVGTLVTIAATVDDAPGMNIWYRFRVRPEGGTYQMIRDFGPENTLDWTAAKHEGNYEMEVTARHVASGATATAALTLEFQSRLTAGQPVVSPTANPLVLLYSAPACEAGERMRVLFQSGEGAVQSTPSEDCQAGLSMNFYLAGMRANSAYTAHHVIATGGALVNGPPVTFATGDLPGGLYNFRTVIPSTNSSAYPFLLGGPLGDSPVASDLAGNVVWYGPPGMTFLTRPEAGGAFWGIVEAPGWDESQQVVRKIDLAGMTLLETNAARVNEQLVAMGKRPISGFHHEARPIANGRVAVLASVEQILTDVQGPGPVDVLGDMIVVLDNDLNVVWTWDAFDHLDNSRAAVLGEQCPNAGCPAFYLAASANDWTHGNALQETADGSFLYSTRNQDWLVKVAYAGGSGDGHVIWRLGKDGDFKAVSGDPYAWFSHQHDGNFELGDATRLMVFDNGNTRVTQMKSGNSRGQVWRIDEENRTATPVVNANLGVYAAAVGSAQGLRDGNYHFHAGFVMDKNGTIDSYSFETDGSGLIRYQAHQDVILYRTFRMVDMYTPN
jgi:hypothetical protein